MDGQGVAQDLQKIPMPEGAWFAAAEAALRDAGRGTVVEQLRSEIAGLPDRPMVSVFGAYDAGKSTLLKRLLVEAGAEVPPWLTVSARRETFEVSEVEAFGCIFRDTPGIAAGSDDHERQALEAVAGSDVVMVVMPPQLLTGDRDLTLALLSGKLFRPDGISMERSSLVVIAKLDEGAVDPVEDTSAYADYVSRKRQEWAGLLKASAVPAEAVSVLAVSADPFQRVGNDPSPSRGDYEDDFRAWDGIADLVRAIAKLPNHLPALRQAAYARRLCWHLWKALDDIEAELAGIVDGQAEAAQSQGRLANFARRLDALLGIARNELDRAVEEELLSFARRGEAEPEAVASRLDACIAQWERTQLSELDKLVGESRVEIEVRERAHRTVATLPKAKALGGVRLTIDQKLVDGVAQHANKTLDAYAKFRLNGKTLTEARKLPDDEREKIATDISSVAKAEFALQCAHAVVSIGHVLYGEFQKDQEAKQLERKRAAAREDLRRLGEQVSQAAWRHLTQQAQVFADWINSSKAQVDSALASSLADKARLAGAAHDLRAALECESVPTA